MSSSSQSPVVVGVDGSDRSLRALDRAVEEAVLRGAPLEVLCGMPPYRFAAAGGGTAGEEGGG
ncbi:universal stress protein, partial [Streptomyces sp. URMC 125]